MPNPPRTVLVTRPADDAGPLCTLLAERGYRPMMAPMLTIEPVRDAAIDLDGCQGVLFTSANGVRAFATLTARRDLTAWCVGEATGAAAAAAGFARVRTADGDVESLARLVATTADPARGPLLHAAGTNLAGDLAGRLQDAGFEVRRRQLYDAVAAAALPRDVSAALASQRVDAVLLYSPRTADSFVRLVGAAGLVSACRTVYAFCLSQAVAEKAGGVPWASTVVAASPDQAALLNALDTSFAE